MNKTQFHKHYNDINRQYTRRMRPALTVHHTAWCIVLHSSRRWIDSSCLSLINGDCAPTKRLRRACSCLLQFLRGQGQTQRLELRAAEIDQSLFIVFTVLLFDNLIAADQSVCTLNWGRRIWACDCIVAKWIWNWYRSPGLPKSRHYSFNKKVENTAKGEQKWGILLQRVCFVEVSLYKGKSDISQKKHTHWRIIHWRIFASMETWARCVADRGR